MKKNLLTTTVKALGLNNDASYAVVAVATAKGIFRPMFTMMDKEQDHETKKYTAMREGLTEAIAIPCYLGISWVAKKIVAPMLYNDKISREKGAKTLSFIGVCTAALVIIPGVCSVFMNPIMNFINKKDHKKNLNTTINAKQQGNIYKIPQEKPATPLSTPYSAFNNVKSNFGMKIGGGL